MFEESAHLLCIFFFFFLNVKASQNVINVNEIQVPQFDTLKSSGFYEQFKHCVLKSLLKVLQHILHDS